MTITAKVQPSTALKIHRAMSVNILNNLVKPIPVITTVSKQRPTVLHPLLITIAKGPGSTAMPLPMIMTAKEQLPIVGPIHIAMNVVD